MSETKRFLSPSHSSRRFFGRFRFFVCCFAVFYFFQVPLSGASDASVGSAWPHEKSDLKPDPAVVYGKLPNGFGYALMQNTRPKDRVSMHLAIFAGSAHESDSQQGLAHFLEHMMFRGTAHFPPGEIVKYFQRIGMDFGPDANAHTGFFETVYDILLPKGDTKSISDGLVVMKDYAHGALLLQTEIDMERGVILAEKRTRDSVSYRTFVSAFTFELPDSLLPRRLPIGQEEILKTADRNLMKSYYDTWYRPDKMVLVMAGDFDPETSVSLIKKAFADLLPQAPAAPEPTGDPIVHNGTKPFYHYEPEAGSTRVGIETVRRFDPVPDSFSFQRTLLIRRFADSIVQHRLDAMLKKPDAPFTSAYAGSGIYFRHARYSEIGAECAPENWKKTLEVLEQTLRKAVLHGFTQSEVDRVKKDFLSDMDNAVRQASTRESQGLAEGIIRNLGNDLVYQSPEQKKSLFAPVAESLTREALLDCFRDNWAATHRLILVTGNAEIGENPEQTIRDTHAESLAQAVLPPEEKKAVVFPYLPKPEKKGKISVRKEIGDLGIVRIRFENGVVLNLKKTDFKADEVVASIVFGKGRSVEPSDASGLAELSEAVIEESGLGGLDKDELERALTGKSTDAYYFVDEQWFGVRGRTVSDQVPTLFALLHAHIVDPGFRENAFVLSMERFRQQYTELERTIDGAMTLSADRFLAGGDSRFGLPAFESFKKLTLENVTSWIAPVLANEPLEISVVGDFEIDRVVDLAAIYFGSLPTRKSDSTGRDAKIVFPSAKTLNLKVPTKINKGLAIVAYPTEDMWDIGRTRRLNVLANIFSERLREAVREKLGAAYTQFAFNHPAKAYPGYGVFQARVYIDPDQADIVVAEMKKIAAELVEKAPLPDELKRAIDPMLTGIKDTLRENGFWLRVLAGSEEHPEQIDWARTILDDHASVTEQDVAKLAGQYLKADKAAVVVVSPEKTE